MFDKMKALLENEKLACTNCGKKFQEGETFTATIDMPAEKRMLVGRLDKVVARSAKRVYCERCKDK